MAKKNTKKFTEALKTMKAATTWEELKKAYVEALQSNPEDADALDAGFETLAPAVREKHKNAKGEEYTKTPKETTEEFRALIATLIALDGCTVEVCGTWLWVSGNTKENKEALKACGFRWSAKKKTWYKAPEGTRRFKSKSGWDMNKIRDVYGSHVVENPDEVA